MPLTADGLTGDRVSVYKLHPMQLVILALSGHEIFMGALFNDFPTDNNHDAMGIRNGGQAMGNHKSGSSLHQIFQSLLHQHFRFGIQSGGGLVKDQYGRVFKQGTGNTKPLFFPAGKAPAQFTDIGGVSFGKTADKPMGISRFGCRLDLLL